MRRRSEAGRTGCYGASMVRRVLAATTIAALGGVGVSSAARLATPAPSSPTTSSASTTSSAASVLVFSGHGFGHGMGMGQWGAYGYALHGWSAEQILEHYYTGTTIGRDATKVVRVLLADAEPRAALGSAAPWKLVDGAGTRVRLPAGPLVVRASLQLGGRKLVSPLTLRPGAAPVELGGQAYHGSLSVVSNGTTLQVVNTVGMEPYLDGVVAAEVPPSWPEAALEAQAIAARSFAISQLDTVDTGSPFDLYADGRSQVYGGIAAETPATTSAVAATAGRVVLYHGKVATTYFGSSSGGETMSAAEGNGVPVPYLVSVADPWDVYAPDHDWGPVLVSASAAGTALGLDGALSGIELTAGASGRVDSATAFGAGKKLVLTGAQLRADLGLDSTWFQLGWLALKVPSGTVPPGMPVELTGLARGLLGVTLESRTAGSAWQPAGGVAPDATGAFSITVSPRVTTWYRLASGTICAGVARVQVSRS